MWPLTDDRIDLAPPLWQNQISSGSPRSTGALLCSDYGPVRCPLEKPIIAGHTPGSAPSQTTQLVDQLSLINLPLRAGSWRGPARIQIMTNIPIPVLSAMQRQTAVTAQLKSKQLPRNAKHLYDICTKLDQRRSLWADVVQMLYKCSVLAEYRSYCFFTLLDSLWSNTCSGLRLSPCLTIYNIWINLKSMSLGLSLQNDRPVIKVDIRFDPFVSGLTWYSA